MPRRRGGQGAIDDRVRLQHMLDAAREATRFAADRTRADLGTDNMLARAMMHAIQEVGEAASHVSDESRARVLNLPWGQIVAMRNVLVHVYWGVNLDKLWRTATEDLPPLIAAIESAVKEWPMPSSS